MTWLLDIEGTTTSIAFVYEVLFPFARRELPTFLSRHGGSVSFAEIVADLREQEEADRRAGLDVPAIAPEGAPTDVLLDSIQRNVLAQMDADRKTTALKRLQGRIWEQGYLDGSIRGHVYPDVPPALRRWRDRGEATYIYSSGSVAAQKLLFGHSDAGDLLPLLSGHFDTTTGPKKEARSYRAIAEQIRARPADVRFVTDNLDEARAAAEAEMNVFVSIRPGTAPLGPHRFEEIHSFDALP